jgi:hypothetical protein
MLFLTDIMTQVLGLSAAFLNLKHCCENRYWFEILILASSIGGNFVPDAFMVIWNCWFECVEVDTALACPADGMDQAASDLLRFVRKRQRLMKGMEALIDGIQRLIQQQRLLVGGVSAGIRRHWMLHRI